MTYRNYLQTTTDDEFVKTRVIAEVARQYPEYDKLPRHKQLELCRKILDTEMEGTNK
jgi:hypothetical protein